MAQKSDKKFLSFSSQQVSKSLLPKPGRRGFPGGSVVKNPPASAVSRVRALVGEDPTCRGAAKPVCHNY